MKILMISHEYPPVGGGGANACMHLAKGYVALGHQATLVTVWYQGLPMYESINGVEIYRVKARRSHKEHCSFQEMLSYLLKALPFADNLQKKNSFDVCHVFFGIPSGPVGLWLKHKYKLPYLIRFGGGDIPGFQERFRLLYKAIGPAVKMLWNGADALTANSKGLQDFALRFYSKKNISIIYNGVDTDFFYPDYSKRDKRKLNLLFVSRLIERKGLQHIIPQLKDIRSRTNKDICLTVVGDGPYRQTLVELTEKHGVGDIVFFVGQKDKAQLPSYYQSGDIFIFPSKREGMPNAVLEAMACGLPIVMTHCEGSDELVDGNGFVTDTDSFAEAITECARRQETLSLRSRELACLRFSWTQAVEQYISLMDDICAKSQILPSPSGKPAI